MGLDKLGRYDIVRVLGKGSMGVVYEARDPFLDRRVAIKTIRGPGCESEAAAEYERRFRTEARSAARLHHPNIVSVFDSGREGDTAYLVMEFVQGDDLKRHLERGVRFSPQSAVKLVLDLLMALDHAHAQNVVHRDVKPANILIESSGRIKLADFGVARIQDTDEGTFTQIGAASLGTPKYMSPEQAQGLPVDRRSDLFSVGVVLYELLTGVRPFEGDNQFIVANQIVTMTPIPPSAVDPDLPAELDPVLAKALAKQPAERYETARDFAQALQAVVQSPTASSEHTVSAPRWGDALAAPLVCGSGASPALFGSRGHTAGSLSGSSSGLQTHAIGQELELEYWKDIKDSTEVQDFSDFLSRFPVGVYAERARRRLERFAKNGSLEPVTSGFAQGALAPHAAETAPAQLNAQLGTAAVAAPDGFEQATARRGRKRLAATVVLVTVLVGAITVVLRRQDDAAQNSGVQARSVATQVGTLAGAGAVPARSSSMPEMATKPSAPMPPSAGHPQASASALGAPKLSTVKPAALAPAPVHAPAPSTSPLVGPSSVGEACADRSFLFRIPCVAQQCAQDRYRRSQECLDFRELEQRREQNRRTP